MALVSASDMSLEKAPAYIDDNAAFLLDAVKVPVVRRLQIA
jgi:hypothetical protein